MPTYRGCVCLSVVIYTHKKTGLKSGFFTFAIQLVALKLLSLASAVDDAAFRKVVRCQFYLYFVAR